MKTILIPIFLVCSFFSMNAQQFSAGIKAGANFSSLTGEAKTKAGPVFGIFGVYSIISNFGVSADVLYSVEGAKYDNVTGNGKVSLNYLRVPVLANVFLGDPGNTFRPKIMFGPNLGFLLSAKTNSAGNTIDSKDAYNGFDVSALVGAGVNIKAGERKWINLDLRYNIGATDILKKRISNENSVQNTGFQITVGYAIGFGAE